MRSLMRRRGDPAPSRLAYRLRRLWLTPYVRAICRLGLPTLALLLATGWFLSQQPNRDAITEKFAEVRRSIEERPEFMVTLMAIDGATAAVSDDIREVVPVDFPVSSFDLDLDGMQARILEIDAVARADIRIRQGGVLQIEITERIPAAVWRKGGDIELLDALGHRVATIAARIQRADLPLLAGAGAERAVPEALAILAAAGPVSDRVRGLVRIGERRWDLVLDRDQRILLPETGPVAALEQVMALQEAQDLLARDIIAVDMRNPARATLRLAPGAAQDQRQITNIMFGDHLE